MDRRKKLRGIVIFGLLAVISVVLLYFISGAPSFSPEMAMHRWEARELLGPSRVIGEELVTYGNRNSILVGETDYGYCVYEYNHNPSVWDGGSLYYHEKADPVTIFSMGWDLMWYGALPGEEQCFLQVFVFPEDLRAVSARLTLTGEMEGAHYEVTQTVSLRQGRYFLFELDVTQVHPIVREFWDIRLEGNLRPYGVSGSATLELFDREGELIETIIMEFPKTI